MKNSEQFKNKRVVIIGLARSGVASANLLFDLGACVSITDSKDSEATRAAVSKLKSKEIKVELGSHSREFIQDNDLVVISPGVPNNAECLIWAQERKIPVISEIELASTLCPATIIAVTGSNGKTTVTTLIGKIIEASGKRAFVCGNIGTPFSGEVAKMQKGDFVSLEVSSFQLERIRDFKPKISLILNFTRNHLDRHKDMQEYLDAKKRIFMNQDKDDFLVLNQDDPVLRDLAKEAKAKVVYFSGSAEFNPDQAAVLSVGEILGIDKKIILNVFKDFKGIQHRLEYVAEINRVKFINDSKATTADSAIWALTNIKSPVFLICGGRHKGVDYSVILPSAAEKVREVILIGEAKEFIRSSLKGTLPMSEAATLEEAVKAAFLKASPGDCVLLSPMCSSFDMFSSYEERGDCFKKIVLSLTKEKA